MAKKKVNPYITKEGLAEFKKDLALVSDGKVVGYAVVSIKDGNDYKTTGFGNDFMADDLDNLISVLTKKAHPSPSDLIGFMLRKLLANAKKKK